MTYKLEFKVEAKAEWERLDGSIKTQFKKKLESVLSNPRIPKNRLTGSADRYKIKLRTVGYRLVYQFDDKRIIVTVIAVGRRDKSYVYKSAKQR